LRKKAFTLPKNLHWSFAEGGYGSARASYCTRCPIAHRCIKHDDHNRSEGKNARKTQYYGATALGRANSGETFMMNLVIIVGGLLVFVVVAYALVKKAK